MTSHRPARLLVLALLMPVLAPLLITAPSAAAAAAVAAEADVTAPTLQARARVREVNAACPGSHVPFAAYGHDLESGTEPIITINAAHILSEAEVLPSRSVVLTRDTGSRRQGTYAGSIPIPADTTPGEFNYTATLRDEAGNTTVVEAGYTTIVNDPTQPCAPVDLRLTRAPDGDLILSWTLNGTVPVSELLIYGFNSSKLVPGSLTSVSVSDIAGDGHVNTFSFGRSYGSSTSVQTLISLPSNPVSLLGPSGSAMTLFNGADRFDTAVNVARQTTFYYGGPIFIATGMSYADALAAGPAASTLGAPVLGVTRDTIPAATAEMLTTYPAGSITVLGGSAAVSDEVLEQLRGFSTGPVRRIAGTDRYSTAAAIALDTFTRDAPVATAFIATGTGFADALSGGAAAAALQVPMLLTAPDSLPEATAEALRSLRPGRIVVLGGQSAVSDRVLDQLSAFTTDVDRIAGANRYETSAAVSAAFFPAPLMTAYLATGQNFPDALAGAPYAGMKRRPLLLTEPHCMPPATLAEVERLEATQLIPFGGDTVVSLSARTRVPC